MYIAETQFVKGCF